MGYAKAFSRFQARNFFRDDPQALADFVVRHGKRNPQAFVAVFPTVVRCPEEKVFAWDDEDSALLEAFVNRA